MKAFGLELRKAGDMKNLYRDVDAILSRVPVGGINADIQFHAVAHSLHTMMKPGKWLDICAIKEASELTGIHISSERISVYRLAHCIHWNDMEPEYRQTLMAMILDDFRPILCPDKSSIVVQHDN
jgi:hypothetical protein